MPPRRLIIVVLGLVLVFSTSLTANAQGQNLLQDPGFEGHYTGRGRGDFNIPEAWGGWWTDTPHTESWMNVAPTGYPHTAGYHREGKQSLHFGKGYGTFTAAVFQQVPDIAPGTTLQATGWAYIENVSEAGSQVKIGIGNNVGGDPYAAGIVWSPWYNTPAAWNFMSVTATIADGGEVTVFMFATQSRPNDPNGVYWDEASLVVTQAGDAPTAGNAQENAVVAPPQNLASFVTAQGTQPDGSIVHTVQSGDTLAAIAVAYGVHVSDILALNNLDNPGMITVGQKLLIKPAPGAESTQEAGSSGPASPEATQETAAVVQPEATTFVEPTIEVTLMPTAIPVTPTDVPPAPVVSVASGNVYPAENPAELASSVCVLLFDDTNKDRIQEEGEPLLAGGTLTLKMGDGTVGSGETDGVSEPLCFSDLAAGDYVALATVPQGYGLTTPAQYQLKVQPGTRLDVQFGAAQGVQEVVAPPASGGDQTSVDSETASTTQNAPNGLLRYSGLLVFGLAGIVLVGGIFVSLVLRRR